MGLRVSVRHAGTARWVAAVVTVGVCSAYGAVAAADNGRIAYEVPPDTAPSIATVNPDGSGSQLMPGVPKGKSANAAWSADGRRLAFSSTASGSSQIYLINADGTGLWQVTNDPGWDLDPTLAPDGTQIAYSNVRNGASQISVVNLKGCTPPSPCPNVTPLTSGPAINQQPRWSPDSNLIAFASARTGTFQIFTMQPSGANPQQLTSDSGSDTDPAWSPGRGAQLAYTHSLITGQRSIYVISRAGGAPRQVTFGGMDSFPAWSPDGREIAFTRYGALYDVPSAGEPAAGAASFITSSGVDAVWAPVVAPVATLATGLVQVTMPGTPTVTISSPSGTVPNPTGAPGAPTGLSLTTGTLVNATAGTVKLSFRAQTQALAATPSTALVHGLAVKVGATTAATQTLSLNLPACSRKASAAFLNRGSGAAHITGTRFRGKSRQIIAAGGEPTYTIVVTCSGTRVTVTSGHVRVIFLQRRHRPVTVRVGHPLFIPAGPKR